MDKTRYVDGNKTGKEFYFNMSSRSNDTFSYLERNLRTKFLPHLLWISLAPTQTGRFFPRCAGENFLVNGDDATASTRRSWAAANCGALWGQFLLSLLKRG